MRFLRFVILLLLKLLNIFLEIIISGEFNRVELLNLDLAKWKTTLNLTVSVCLTI